MTELLDGKGPSIRDTFVARPGAIFDGGPSARTLGR